MSENIRFGELKLFYANTFAAKCQELCEKLKLGQIEDSNFRKIIESGQVEAAVVGADDLLSRGFSPGPKLGAALKELHLQQLEGAFSSLEDAQEAIQALSKQ